MKRARGLYEKYLTRENAKLALLEVNRTHRWTVGHRPNRTVRRIEANIEGAVDALLVIAADYRPNAPRMRRRWDESAGKWRDIYEPDLWPDQYVHHMAIQTLQPVLMRGMDGDCCGSIPGRGIHYGMKRLRKWMKDDRRGTKWCAEMDVRHFYDSLRPGVVMDVLRRRIKDRRMLDVCERLMAHGVLIGAYFSQWFANTVLQGLDRLIRGSGCARHYLRYMDNITVLGSNKRKLRRLVEAVRAWLCSRGLDLKGTWQVFPTKAREVAALGYRFAPGGGVRLRKRNRMRLMCQLRRYRKRKVIDMKFASGLLSRLGAMQHCRNTVFYRKYLPYKAVRRCKAVVGEWTRKEMKRWSMYSEPSRGAA